MRTPAMEDHDDDLDANADVSGEGTAVVVDGSEPVRLVSGAALLRIFPSTATTASRPASRCATGGMVARVAALLLLPVGRRCGRCELSPRCLESVRSATSVGAVEANLARLLPKPTARALLLDAGAATPAAAPAPGAAAEENELVSTL